MRQRLWVAAVAAAIVGLLAANTGQVDAEQNRLATKGDRVTVTGIASTWLAESGHVDRKGAHLTEAREVLVIESDRHGMVVLEQEEAPRVDAGSEITVTGTLSADGRLKAERIDALKPPSRTTQTQLERWERRRAEIERADAERRRKVQALIEERLALVDRDTADGKLDLSQKELTSTLLQPPPPVELSMLVIPHWCGTTNPDGPGSGFFGTPPPTQAELTTYVNGDLSDWFETATLGGRSFSGTSTPWLDVCAGGTEVSPEAAAAAAGFDPDSYDRLVLLSDAGSLFLLGVAESLPGRRVLINFGEAPIGVMAFVWHHELGHLEGLFHANDLECTSLASGNEVRFHPKAFCHSDEYGDLSDTMGQPVDTGTPHFGTVNAEQWLAPSQLPELGPGTHTIAVGEVGSGLLWDRVGVKIPLPWATYYVESRDGSGIDAGLAPHPGLTEGLQIRVVGTRGLDSSAFEFTEARNSNLLDMTPGDDDEHARVLPYGDTLTTLDGLTISGTEVFPGVVVITATIEDLGWPSAARDVEATLDPDTGMVDVTWLPPSLNPGAALFAADMSPGWSTFPGPATSVTLGPVGDVHSSVRVTSISPGGAGGAVAGSDLVFSYPMPTAPIDIQVTEADADVSGAEAINLAYGPLGPQQRSVRYVPVTGQLDDLTVTATSATGGLGTVSAAWGVAGDNDPEPDETFDIEMRRELCSTSHPGCVVWDHIGQLTIIDDD